MEGTIISSITRAIDKFAARIRSSSGSSSSELCTVEEDLVKTKSTLLWIQEQLDGAEERRDVSANLWLSELRGIAYAAENILVDSESGLPRFDLEQENQTKTTGKRKREEVRNSTNTSTQVSIPDCVKHKLKEIRKRFDEIATEWGALSLRDTDGERRSGNSRQTLSGFQVDESYVYGREDDKEKVIKLLFSDEATRSDVSVIPVVGVEGVGKTTLAQLVYNDSRIIEHFDIRGWVSVSQDFDIIRLEKAIIESITGKPCCLQELSALQVLLEKLLKGKRLFLVLDDVWNEKQSLWECLRVCLIGERMNKILVTTRNEEVGKIMKTVPSYHLGCLTEDQCWLLFHRCAFDRQDPDAHPNLVEIGKKIAAKCDGLPLAAKTLGGLLRFETDEDRWKDILQSDLLELVGEMI